MHFLRLGDYGLIKDVFSRLLEYQNNFSKKHSLGDYRWSKSPLLEWSRCCEYPAVWRLLEEYKGSRLSVLDYGCGKTFFPFFLNDNGFDVTCLDIDDYTEFYGSKEGIKFVTDDEGLAGTQDLVYSVSVLEHTEDPVREIEKIYNLLKDDGVLVLTLDVDVRGDLSISMDGFVRLVDCLNSKFNSIEFEQCDSGPLLTYLNSPYGLYHQGVGFLVRRYVGAALAKIGLSKNKNRMVSPYDLRVGVYAGKKRVQK